MRGCDLIPSACLFDASRDSIVEDDNFDAGIEAVREYFRSFFRDSHEFLRLAAVGKKGLDHCGAVGGQDAGCNVYLMIQFGV